MTHTILPGPMNLSQVQKDDSWALSATWDLLPRVLSLRNIHKPHRSGRWLISIIYTMTGPMRFQPYLSSLDWTRIKYSIEHKLYTSEEFETLYTEGGPSWFFFFHFTGLDPCFRPCSLYQTPHLIFNESKATTRRPAPLPGRCQKPGSTRL